jgi:outer membrane protein OmpA-like peptidoglycan-associated protein
MRPISFSHLKYVILLLAIGVFVSKSGWGQHFSFKDSTFHVGDCLIDQTITFKYKSTTDIIEGQLFLDSLVLFLQKNPLLIIEVGVHNDERANVKASLFLTPLRAEYIAQYLMEQGIRSERIHPKGYESDKPLVRAAKTAEEHSLNRRIEIIILDTH